MPPPARNAIIRTAVLRADRLCRTDNRDGPRCSHGYVEVGGEHDADSKQGLLDRNTECQLYPLPSHHSRMGLALSSIPWDIFCEIARHLTPRELVLLGLVSN